MQFQTPTITSLINAALTAAKARSELLLLLAALAGIGTSIVYEPAMKVIQNLMAAMETIGQTEGAETEAARIFEDGVSTLLFGHLATTAISTFLLIPFARASAPGVLLPGEGGLQAFWIRGLRSFLHMVAVSGIIMLLVLVAVPIVALLGSAFGALGNAIMFAAACLIIWATFALTGTAHLAIAAEARDRKETIPAAFMRARLFMAPIAGSLGLIMLAMMLINFTFGSIIIGMMPEGFQARMGMIISGMVLYIASALHVAALYKVPDFRDLRPS